MLNYLSKYLDEGIRFDGRALDEFRDIKVTENISETAEGSCMVQIGNTKVMAGVKMAIEKPFPDTPDQGILMVNAELIPMASDEFESGPPDVRSIELARVVDRGIRESHAVDLKKLCIEPGEKVWTIMVDVIPINHDGNLIDACALAAMIAIKNARFPEQEDGIINYKKLTDEKLPILKKPIAVTVSKINGKLLVDLTEDEENYVDARLTVTVTQDGKLCALQKGGDEGVTKEEIEKMVNLAIEKSMEIRKKVGL